MLQLQVATLVAAPLTVAFDVARAQGHPWPFPLREVWSDRPAGDLYVAGPGHGWRWVAHARRFTPTASGTLVTDEVDAGSLLGPGADRLLGRRVRRAVTAHLDACTAAAELRARDVVQVVGAAVVDGDRVLVAQRRGGVFDGRWEFPGGKVEPGEAQLDALVRECREELGGTVRPQGFLGEVVLDVAIGGAPRGSSTMRVWWARPGEGELVAREHTALRWVTADELDALDWIPADRPLLPAVRAALRP